MKKIQYDDHTQKKNTLDDDELYEQRNHQQYLNWIVDGVDFSFNRYICRHLKTKYGSYKSQDKKKSRYDEEKYITYAQMIQKLQNCELICYYCNIEMTLVYRNKNEKHQWSLERFDNNLGHYDSNTCIACLRCNLQRRNDNHEYFKQSKQWSLVKLS
tara:strand:- start:820 stop:1290 length:471 start_codon:yes stop_codon:yes gene_type:complete